MTADDLHARADCARRNPVVLRDGKPVVTITCDHADALANLIDAAREVERLAALRGFRGGALADALAALEADQIVTGGEESGAVTPSAPASFPAPDPSGDSDPTTEALIAAAYEWADAALPSSRTGIALADAVNAHREAHDG